ncbi:hypothetical protein FACS1894193_07930 [Bacilli bacterium]|nr:hypothetical protein FACS1894192_09670 [Bacilli bacterium]GHU42492.1 hypothetical protein FACS1894193_07930 [Bacilli bacterium]
METFLLDKESKYILKIIGELSMAPTKSISFKKLENRIGLTKKTIITYIGTLEGYCKENNINPFIIDNQKIRLSAKSNFNVLDLYSYMTQHAVKYQIMTRVLLEPQVSSVKLYLDLALSKSNFSVHLKQLNNFLKSYRCQINFLHKTPLQGKERQIRFLYYNLFWGLHPDTMIPDFPGLETITDLTLELIPHISYPTLSKIKLLFYVTYIRRKHGYFIDSEENYSLPDSPYISFDDFFTKLDCLNLLMDCPDLETKRRECRYLYFLFSRFNLVTLEECQNDAFEINGTEAPEIACFIAKFQTKSNLTFQTHELKYLHYNLTILNREATVFKGKSKVFDLKNMVLTFNETKGNTATFIKEFLMDIREKCPQINTLMERFPTLYYYYAMIMTAIVEKHHQPIKLLVQSSISTLHREFLIQKIIKGAPFPVQIYTASQLKGEKPDGIISNWLPDKKYQDIPFFSTSLFYSDWSRDDLTQFIYDLSDQKNQLR